MLHDIRRNGDGVGGEAVLAKHEAADVVTVHRYDESLLGDGGGGQIGTDFELQSAGTRRFQRKPHRGAIRTFRPAELPFTGRPPAAQVLVRLGRSDLKSIDRKRKERSLPIALRVPPNRTHGDPELAAIRSRAERRRAGCVGGDQSKQVLWLRHVRRNREDVGREARLAEGEAADLAAVHRHDELLFGDRGRGKIRPRLDLEKAGSLRRQRKPHHGAIASVGPAELSFADRPPAPKVLVRFGAPGVKPSGRKQEERPLERRVSMPPNHANRDAELAAIRRSLDRIRARRVGSTQGEEVLLLRHARRDDEGVAREAALADRDAADVPAVQGHQETLLQDLGGREVRARLELDDPGFPAFCQGKSHRGPTSSVGPAELSFAESPAASQVPARLRPPHVKARDGERQEGSLGLHEGREKLRASPTPQALRRLIDILRGRVPLLRLTGERSDGVDRDAGDAEHGDHRCERDIHRATACLARGRAGGVDGDDPEKDQPGNEACGQARAERVAAPPVHEPRENDEVADHHE